MTEAARGAAESAEMKEKWVFFGDAFPPPRALVAIVYRKGWFGRGSLISGWALKDSDMVWVRDWGKCFIPTDLDLWCLLPALPDGVLIGGCENG